MTRFETFCLIFDRIWICDGYRNQPNLAHFNDVVVLQGGFNCLKS